MAVKKQNDVIGKVYIGLLTVILAGIVVHAPLSVGFGVLLPGYELLIKSWKEILMLIAGVLLLIILYKQKRCNLLKDKIIGLVFLYAIIHLVMLATGNGLNASLAGLSIDLRYVFYFSLVYLGLKLYPDSKKLLISTAIFGALAVLGFALLQIFVLPVDILKYIGYNQDTIAPYLTVDLNEAFIRINSTLRGPNPLGAYSMTVLSLVVVYILKQKMPSSRFGQVLLGLLTGGGLLALWHSYSRSALLALVASLLVVGMVYTKNRHNLTGIIKKHAKLLAVLSVAAMLVFVATINNQQFVSNVLLHENPNDSNSLNSNEGHASSLVDGIKLAISQPFGSGIGSTGSASLFTNNPLIIENQYLFIAHEVGWFGLVVFLWLTFMIVNKLWKNKEDWLSLGVLASGCGLMLIGLLLPVWVDDTVSIVWWGLTAVALAGNKRVLR